MFNTKIKCALYIFVLTLTIFQIIIHYMNNIIFIRIANKFNIMCIMYHINVFTQDNVKFYFSQLKQLLF